MATVNMHEAKTQFSKLVSKVEAGEEVIIARGGKPVAKLVKIEAQRRSRPKFGYMKGQIWMSPDFDVPDLELERLWHEGPIEPTQPAPVKRKKKAG